MSLENSPGFLLNFSECEMNDEEKHCYRFKSFRLDVKERQLLYNGSPVPLTPKAFDVLAVLVERSGHLVAKDELLKRVWGDSFVEEANVARIVHTLRKALGEDENGNKFIETVAKKGYRFVANVSEIRQSSALNSADDKQDSLNFVETPSAAELQIPPAKADKPVSQPAVSPKQKIRIPLFAVGFLSAVFLVVLLAFYFQPKPSSNPNKVKSIAVLPLRPLTAENRDPIYELGIVDSLILKLGATKNLIIRPLSATRKYTDIAQDPLAAGREQQVDYVLAANYQLVDGKIKVTAQLFNVANGHLEETYKSEKNVGKVFAIQDAIADEVGNILLARLATTSSRPVAKRGTANEEAYRHYLHGKNLTGQATAADANRAIEYFEQAIRLDPNFARAYAAMAHAYSMSGILGGGVPGVEQEKAKEAVTKALELDGNLAEGYTARADLKLKYQWDFGGAEKDLLRAIELQPNQDLPHWLYALVLAYRGRIDEAMTEIETALAIVPNSLIYQRDRGRILYYARRYDEAIVELERVIELDEKFWTAYDWLWDTYEMKGDYAGAYKTFIKCYKQGNSDRFKAYQRAYETAGWKGVRRKKLEIIKQDELTPRSAIAVLSALLGEKEEAFKYFNEALEKREWGMIMMNVEPTLDSLRSDPRFDELVRRVGFK